jgi:tRNA (guanine-N7-)-methyltransferase
MTTDRYDNCPTLPSEGELDLRALFPTERGVEIEIGAARGWFMVERLRAEPNARIVGLEIRRKWAFLAGERLSTFGLGERGRAFLADARNILPRVVPESVSAAFFHFPDPWWKKRHQKRLVVNDVMLRDLARVLCSGGELFIQTDVPERADEYERLLQDCPDFVPGPSGSRLPDNPYGARSPRERQAMADGLPVHRLHYVRAPR